jgi:hypothetical protein
MATSDASPHRDVEHANDRDRDDSREQRRFESIRQALTLICLTLTLRRLTSDIRDGTRVLTCWQIALVKLNAQRQGDQDLGQNHCQTKRNNLCKLVTLGGLPHRATRQGPNG